MRRRPAIRDNMRLHPSGSVMTGKNVCLVSAMMTALRFRATSLARKVLSYGHQRSRRTGVLSNTTAYLAPPAATWPSRARG
jgi:hypothetical protein